MEENTNLILDEEEINDDLQDELIIKVDRNQSPLRIDSFLNDKIKNVSRTRIPVSYTHLDVYKRQSQ